MPPVSEKQRRAMYAAAEGRSTLGIPKSVGKEFIGKDALSDAIHKAITDAKHEPVSEKQRKAMYAAAEGESKLGIPEKVGKEFTDSADQICAGIMLRAPGPLFLLVQNADDGQWVQPGGHVEDGESLEEAAQREAYEEVGPYVGGPRVLFRRSKSNGIDFTCYLQDVEVFHPEIDEESLNARWVTADDLPDNTHPEVAKSIAIAAGNELDIAKAIRSGEVYSPQPYENAWYFAVRITGTGVSYRASLDEYVYRPPEVFLSDEMLERYTGLDLIFEHPEESILNTEEYRNRSIGKVILPYVKEDVKEAWGIAKVLDSDAAELMMQSHISTSPAVVFRDAGSTETIEVDGKKVLVEGNPSLIDHLAICQEGVWDKGGKPNGVKLQEDSTVDNENEMPAWADDVMKKLDSMNARMDAIENKGGDKFADAEEKEDCAKSDSSEEAEEAGEREEKHEEEAIKELEMAKKEGEEEKREEKSDRKDARKDASEEEKEDARKDSEDRKDRKDEAYMDSQKRENAELRRKIEQMEARLKPLSHADRDALSQAQARADGVMQLFGKTANAPLAGENPVAYRKRLADSLKKYSADMKSVRMDSLTGEAFDLVESKIYADAQSAALNPAEAPVGRLIPMVRRDSTGREVTTFAGDPNAWMQHFKSAGAVCRINRARKES